MLAYDSFLDTNLPIYPTIVQPHYLNLNSLSLYKTGVLISIKKHKKRRTHSKRRHGHRDDRLPKKGKSDLTARSKKTTKVRGRPTETKDERQRGERWTEAETAACFQSAIANRQALKARQPIGNRSALEIKKEAQEKVLCKYELWHTICL